MVDTALPDKIKGRGVGIKVMCLEKFLAFRLSRYFGLPVKTRPKENKGFERPKLLQNLPKMLPKILPKISLKPLSKLIENIKNNQKSRKSRKFREI